MICIDRVEFGERIRDASERIEENRKVCKPAERMVRRFGICDLEGPGRGPSLIKCMITFQCKSYWDLSDSFDSHVLILYFNVTLPK